MNERTNERRKESMNQSSKQPTNQPINPSIHQSINQSSNQSIKVCRAKVTLLFIFAHALLHGFPQFTSANNDSLQGGMSIPCKDVEFGRQNGNKIPEIYMFQMVIGNESRKRKGPKKKHTAKNTSKEIE